MFILGISIIIPSYGQNIEAKKSKISLYEILTSIERKYEVSFSYVDDVVEDIFLFPPSANLSLNELLLKLEELASLKFTRIDNNFIAVSKEPKVNNIFRGYLLDSDTGEKIPYASIEYNPVFILSDSLGCFEIQSTRDSIAITIRHLGYYSKKIQLKRNEKGNCAEIRLIANVQVLGEILIPNYLISGIDKLKLGGLSFTTNDLKILPGLNEPDIFFSSQSFPGIYSVDESVSSINIRGGRNDQNLFLWDGIRLYQNGHFFGLISAFNPYFINRVEVIKNGTTAAYGGGVSSVYDIKTANELIKDFSIDAGINLLNVELGLNLPLSKNASLSISARRSIADVYRTPTYNQYFERAFSNSEINVSSTQSGLKQRGEDFKFHDFNLKLIKKFSDKDFLKLSFLKISNKLSNREELTGLNPIVLSRTSFLEQDSKAFGIYYKRKWSQNLVSNASVSFSDYQLDSQNNDLINRQKLNQLNVLTDIGTRLEIIYQFAEGLELKAGYHYSEISTTNLEELTLPAFRQFTRRVVNSHVQYGEIKYFLPKYKSLLKFGLRNNYYHELRKNQIEPRFAFNKEVSNEISIEILAERKNQIVSQIIDLQTDFLGVEKRRWILANDDNLPIIMSNQISFGGTYKSKGLQLTSTIYWKNVDGIVTSGEGFRNQFEFIRLSGSYQSSGLELLINRSFINYSLWLSYAFSKSNYVFNQAIENTFTSNFDIPHNVSVGINYEYKKYQFSSGFNLQSGRVFTEINEEFPLIGGQINYREPNGSRLKNYFRADISAKYNFNLSKKLNGIIGFSIWNFTNHSNLISAYFRENERGVVERIEEKALGLAPHLQFRISFK